MSDSDYTYTGVFQLMQTNAILPFERVHRYRNFNCSTRESVEKVSEPMNGAMRGGALQSE